MSDLIENLRNNPSEGQCAEAADEIERLRVEVEAKDVELEIQRASQVSAVDRMLAAEVREATARRDGREDAALLADEFYEDSVHDPSKGIHGKTAADIAVAIRAISTPQAPPPTTGVGVTSLDYVKSSGAFFEPLFPAPATEEKKMCLERAVAAIYSRVQSLVAFFFFKEKNIED